MSCSRVLVYAVLILLALCGSASSQTCGITSPGSYTYNLALGQVSLGVTADTNPYTLNPCSTSSNCNGGGGTTLVCSSNGGCYACTDNFVALAFTSSSITWSFLNSSIPQLGVKAVYSPVPDVDPGTLVKNFSLLRQLTVIYVCGDDADGFSSIQGPAVSLPGSVTLLQYTYNVPTSVLCGNSGGS